MTKLKHIVLSLRDTRRQPSQADGKSDWEGGSRETKGTWFEKKVEKSKIY